jgi:hypothetical protein
VATTTRADKHLIAPGSLAEAVVQALRHIGPERAAELAQIAAPHLSPNDKKTLASTAVQAPAWMRSTLLSIADPAAVGTGNFADLEGTLDQ